MRLTVAGCSGSFPGPESACSCYLVEAEGFRLVVDLGNGALGPLQRHCGRYDIDAVLLSHLHGDHCLDLCSYYVARKYLPSGPAPPVPVYAPAAAPEHVARASGLTSADGMRQIFDFRTLSPGRFGIGPFTVTADRVNHPIETFGVRIEYGGAALTYSADTGTSDALVRLASGADMLLCEASFHEGRDQAADLHLNGRGAAEHAARAGVGRLLLTHLPPWNDPERSLAETEGAYDGAISVVRAGATYEFR